MSIPPNQAPQQQPYGAPQQPYGYPTAPQPTGSNGFAVAGLILAFLFSPLGLIFSIIGLVKVKSTGKGKVPAIIGLILSVLSIAVGITVFAVIGSKVVKAIDPGCTSATTTVTTYSDKISADATNPTALKADLKGAADELNAAAAKAGNADAKKAISALASDYQQMYTAVSTGTPPNPDLQSKIQTDANKVDSACGHIGS